MFCLEQPIPQNCSLLVYPKAANVMEEIEAEGADVRPFSRNASGTVWGEGVGALILKPLSKAISDNNRILGVIKGSAVNSNGKSNGITAPSASAQQEVIMHYMEAAGFAEKVGVVSAVISDEIAVIAAKFDTDINTVFL